MALVSLSSVAVFFDGDAKLMTSAVRMPMIRIVSPTYFLFDKEPGMRDRTYPVQVSFRSRDPGVKFEHQCDVITFEPAARQDADRSMTRLVRIMF